MVARLDQVKLIGTSRTSWVGTHMYMLVRQWGLLPSVVEKHSRMWKYLSLTKAKSSVLSRTSTLTLSREWSTLANYKGSILDRHVNHLRIIRSDTATLHFSYKIDWRRHYVTRSTTYID